MLTIAGGIFLFFGIIIGVLLGLVVLYFVFVGIWHLFRCLISIPIDLNNWSNEVQAERYKEQMAGTYRSPISKWYARQNKGELLFVGVLWALLLLSIIYQKAF